MKYYCQNCGAEIKPGHTTKHIDYDLKSCLFCGGLERDKLTVKVLPAFETPEQNEKRTGNTWPENGAVWFRKEDDSIADFVWGVCRYTTAKRCGDRDVVCVQGPNPPPDDWRQE